MTSLACWLGVDQRGPASLYIAGDSRFTWPNGTLVGDGQKTFASPTTPDVFAFCGDAWFPSLLFKELQSIHLSSLAGAHDRHTEVLNRVQNALAAQPKHPYRRFTIIHGARDSQGMTASFHLWQTSWAAAGECLDIVEPLPTESVLALAVGSGERSVIRQDVGWRNSDVGRTSRAVFSGFCDAVRSGDDPLTGGSPQLVGLFRKGPAEAFGVVFGGRRYLYGKVVPSAESAGQAVEWRNVLFERCDPYTMQVLQGAQRHARPRRK